jgi:hypothetical protein
MTDTNVHDERMQKWAALLESGEFTQTQQVLRDEQGYCCLGVACELYRRETGQGRWDENSYHVVGRFFFRDDDGDANGELPTARVREWFGLSAGTMHRFAALNDNLQWTFAQIAAVVRGSEQFPAVTDDTNDIGVDFDSTWEGDEDGTE